MQITRIRRLPFSFVRVEASGTITTLSSTDYPPMVMESTLLGWYAHSFNLSRVDGCHRGNGPTPSQTWSGQLFSTLNGRCFSVVGTYLISSSVCSFPPHDPLLSLRNSHPSHPFMSHFFTALAAGRRLCCNLLTCGLCHCYCAPGCTEVT